MAAHAVNTPPPSTPPARVLAVYLVLGTFFGIVLIKGEVISWFRIYEMFRFESFHMYGIIGSAVVTAMLSLRLLRSRDARSLSGEAIAIPPKELGRGTRYWLGGSLFGVGWGLVGACPGPLFALIGGGVAVMWAVLLSAIVGTFLYGVLAPRLPH